MCRNCGQSGVAWSYSTKKGERQMNPSTERRHIRDMDSRLVLAEGEGVGWTGSLGLVDASYHI